jgi:hypothetical protein
MTTFYTATGGAGRVGRPDPSLRDLALSPDRRNIFVVQPSTKNSAKRQTDWGMSSANRQGTISNYEYFAKEEMYG